MKEQRGNLKHMVSYQKLYKKKPKKQSCKGGTPQGPPEGPPRHNKGTVGPPKTVKVNCGRGGVAHPLINQRLGLLCISLGLS